MPFDREIKNPALILGGDLGGLWAARILGKKGIAVYIVTDKQQDFALSSKYCKKKIVTTMPWDYNVLVKILKRAARATSKRLVVYPGTDDLVLSLSRIKEEIPDDFHFVVGKKNSAETLVNKKLFYQMLKKKNIQHPTTFFPKNIADTIEISAKISYPIFVKPSMTHLFNKAFGFDKKGFVANSREELIKYYRLLSSAKVDVLFQEIITGGATNLYQLEGYYNQKNCPSVLFARQAIRIWPLNFGNTTLCQSISLSDLKQETEGVNKLLQHMKYTGMMSADFKRDPTDGKLKLLDINTRLWLHFWLPVECGANILHASYQDAVGEKIQNSDVYAVGVKSLHFPSDRESSKNMIQRGELSLLEYASSMIGKKVYAYFSRKDILPFFHFYCNFILQTYGPSHLKKTKISK